MELSQLEAFVAIAEAKGFSKAALKLNITQPAISRRIRQLEEVLDAPLFERISTGVVLTEPGVRFLPYARQAIASVKDGIAAVRDRAGEARGEVTCAIVGTLASTGITDVIRTFCREFPQVELKLHTALSAEVSALVLAGEANLGLRYFNDPNPDLNSLHLGDEPVVPVISAETGKDGGADIRQSAVHSRWLTFPPEKNSSQLTYAALLRQQILQAGIEGAEFVDVDSLTAQKRMIEAGFGCGLLPVSAIREELQRGTLRIMDWPQLRTRMPVYLVHRVRAYISPALDRLMAALRTTTF